MFFNGQGFYCFLTVFEGVFFWVVCSNSHSHKEPPTTRNSHKQPQTGTSSHSREEPPTTRNSQKQPPRHGQQGQPETITCMRTRAHACAHMHVCAHAHMDTYKHIRLCIHTYKPLKNL